jgi:hypothetical protein
LDFFYLNKYYTKKPDLQIFFNYQNKFINFSYFLLLLEDPEDDEWEDPELLFELPELDFTDDPELLLELPEPDLTDDPELLLGLVEADLIDDDELPDLWPIVLTELFPDPVDELLSLLL